MAHQDVLREKPYLSLLHTASASFKECPAVPGCAMEALDLMGQQCFLIFIYLEIFIVFN